MIFSAEREKEYCCVISYGIRLCPALQIGCDVYLFTVRAGCWSRFVIICFWKFLNFNIALAFSNNSSSDCVKMEYLVMICLYIQRWKPREEMLSRHTKKPNSHSPLCTAET